MFGCPSNDDRRTPALPTSSSALPASICVALPGRISLCDPVTSGHIAWADVRFDRGRRVHAEHRALAGGGGGAEKAAGGAGRVA
jgi:hypothetical protein